MTLNNVVERLRGRYRNVLPYLLYKRPLSMHSAYPVISFTFDDFPRSAWLMGGSILEEHGFTGTYFVSLGCMGQDSPSGRLFDFQDLNNLIDKGHELGCHTHSHLNAWETRTPEFMASVELNRKALSELMPGAEFKTFSYPIDHPRLQTKKQLSRRFRCCRGGGQKINQGTLDLNILHAFFLDKRRDDLNGAKRIIDENAAACGWLIFGTHDVCDHPSQYGCTPDFFEEVVRYSVKSGAKIMPVTRALEVVSA